MHPTTASLIRHHCRPLAPIPTGVAPRLAPLPGIRAVLFDIYGTLLVSATGDIGSGAANPPGEAFAQALQAAGLTAVASGEQGAALFREVVEQFHAESRGRGVEYPEVDIVEVWRRLLPRTAAIDPSGATPTDELLRRVAVEYEVRVNPVWPMPHLEPTLAALAESGYRLGVISNAQFYTPELFVALLGKSLADLAIAPEMQYYSYRAGEAKPGMALYQAAQRQLQASGITPGETLYVGNDLLNDCLPAAQIGFRTALFAGDRRSLRMREGDPRVANLTPDAIVTDLADVLGMLQVEVT